MWLSGGSQAPGVLRLPSERDDGEVRSEAVGRPGTVREPSCGRSAGRAVEVTEVPGGGFPGQRQDRSRITCLLPAQVNVGVGDLVLTRRQVGPGPCDVRREASQAPQLPLGGLRLPVSISGRSTSA